MQITEKITDKYSPGPGRYNSIDIKQSGKYPISNFRNTAKSIQWENYKENRFPDFGIKLIKVFLNFIDNKTPGPGRYTPRTSIDGTGSIFPSQFKSSTAKSFHRKIKNPPKTPTPGPGTYSAFSEFGYNYDYLFTQRKKSKEKIKIKSKGDKINLKNYTNILNANKPNIIKNIAADCFINEKYNSIINNDNKDKKEIKNIESKVENRDYMRYFQIKEEVKIFFILFFMFL